MVVFKVVPRARSSIGRFRDGCAGVRYIVLPGARYTMHYCDSSDMRSTNVEAGKQSIAVSVLLIPSP
jgi:hypothetical protein